MTIDFAEELTKIKCTEYNQKNINSEIESCFLELQKAFEKISDNKLSLAWLCPFSQSKKIGGVDFEVISIIDQKYKNLPPSQWGRSSEIAYYRSDSMFLNGSFLLLYPILLRTPTFAGKYIDVEINNKEELMKDLKDMLQEPTVIRTIKKHI